VISLFWMLVWSDRRRGGVVRDQPVMRERDVY
jgi:hypothetical protein